MLANGVYRARAKTWTLAETSKGGEQIAVEFEILDSPSTITWYGHFTEKTWERTVESLRHCGWRGTDLSDLAGLDANEVELVVEQEEWEGKVRAKVKWVNKPGGVAVSNPLSPDRAKTFAARMKGAIIKKQQAEGTPPSARSPEPPPHGDDDLPF